MHAAERRQERNKTARTITKSEVRKANKAIVAGDAETAKTAVKNAASTLDKAAGNKIIHKNNAARKKSRLTKKLNKITAAPAK
jgi:small subunit ribosomal protein S20